MIPLPSSLRGRLLAGLLASTLVMGLAALIDTWREAIRTANTVSDRVLTGSALAIAERVVVSEDGTLEVDIPYVALEMLTSAAQDRVFYRVDGPPGTFITGYSTLPTHAMPMRQNPDFRDETFQGEAIRLAVLERSASTGVNSVPFIVTVAETTIGRRALARAIILRSALRLAAMSLGAAIVVWISVSYALKPLNRLSDAIAERNPNDLHPLAEPAPEETRGLVETVNSFMIRLRTALDALRNFTGNASHQLRTPLAIIRTQLALAARATTLDDAKAAALKGDKAVADAERILAQLLLMAKIEAESSRRAYSENHVDLVELAQGITAEHIPDAAAAGLDLGFEGAGGATIDAEPLLLGELLKNLIANAIAYAGKDAEITVRAGTRGTVPFLEVEDNGPGIPLDRRHAVLQRFTRDADTTPGTGLGLPIADEIASLFGGRLMLSDRKGGSGLNVTVVFPGLDRPVAG